MRKIPWLKDTFTKYDNRLMYLSIHCYKIDDGISSFPGAEFFNELITVMISNNTIYNIMSAQSTFFRLF